MNYLVLIADNNDKIKGLEIAARALLKSKNPNALITVLSIQSKIRTLKENNLKLTSSRALGSQNN